MTKLLAVASLVLFCAPLAIGQSLNTQVIGTLEGGQGLCSQNGTSKASCAGVFQENPNVSAGASILATADYGVVTASSGAVANCGTGCEIGATAQTTNASFNDSATLQGVPSSGAFFLITVDVSGSVSDPNATGSNFVLQINDARHTANCTFLTPNGHCSRYIPVTNGDTVYFNAVLGNFAIADLVVAGGGNGTLTEFAIGSGRITELAVVNQQHHVLNNVIITTASGHQYPL
jgi:hypothetical protein